MAEIVLIVEDEIALQETLAYNLEREGYEVKIAGDGPTAITIAYEIKPDIILLDIMLPGMDGFEVCRNIRKEMNTPILMLTARDDEIDRVVGLEVGADDYLTKPFSMRELIARVKAMLRRVKLIRQEIGSTPAESPAKTVKFDNLLIDMTRHEVKLGDDILTMKPKEYDLLLYLANHRGQVLTRDHILQELWGWDYTGDSRTVDVHIRWLREKIESSPENPKRIITVRGTGYRFEG
ncbi:MAG: response regulator transcription factor [Anaerolineaceae bacterium]|nr:response regulator transcription factor [Anaerolineaceae bacterium]NTV35970.1 response regulator transcription factor [Anaerolineaceae bacterium]